MNLCCGAPSAKMFEIFGGGVNAIAEGQKGDYLLNEEMKTIAPRWVLMNKCKNKLFL